MRNQGYIAVTSAVLISVVLMVLVFTVSYTGFLNRFNILDTSFKESSRSLAEACVAEARLKIAQNIAYPGNETISVGTAQCTIMPIEDTLPGLLKTIKAKATVQNAVTNLKVGISIPLLPILSWEEVENF